MKWKFATRAIRIGSEADTSTGATIPPVYLTSTYTQKIPGEPIDGYDYSRCKNPSRDSFARCIASLENTKHAIATTTFCPFGILLILTYSELSVVINAL